MKKQECFRTQTIDYIKSMIGEYGISKEELFEECYRDKIFRNNAIIKTPLKVMLKDGRVVEEISKNDDVIGILAMYYPQANRYYVFKVEYLENIQMTEQTWLDYEDKIVKSVSEKDKIEWDVCSDGAFNCLLKCREEFRDTYLKILSNCPLFLSTPFVIRGGGRIKNLGNGEQESFDCRKHTKRNIMFYSTYQG